MGEITKINNKNINNFLWCKQTMEGDGRQCESVAIVEWRGVEWYRKGEDCDVWRQHRVWQSGVDHRIVYGMGVCLETTMAQIVLVK